MNARYVPCEFSKFKWKVPHMVAPSNYEISDVNDLYGRSLGHSEANSFAGVAVKYLLRFGCLN